MRKLILLFMLVIVSGLVSAADFVYTEPYSDTFTPENQLGKSLDGIRSEMDTKSCYTDANWQNKDCNYLYYCYAVLPSTSNDIGDAILRECVDVTTMNTVSLEIKDFIPPKGILYYVVTFVFDVNMLYDENAQDWQDPPATNLPTEYINANSIRNVCPAGQMLDFDAARGEYRCLIAERACLDTLNTGLCTNVYNLWVLDKDSSCGIEDGIVSDTELECGGNYCADRPLENFPDGDGICDLVVDLECVDTCSAFDIDTGACTVPGPNGLCDEWDQAVNYGCWDDVLSPNSKICDALDVVGCFSTFDPVCVGGRDGTTYPNKCFAEKGQGIPECPDDTPALDCYNAGSACEPPITQCYDPTDCPDLSVCLGGSTAGISKQCLGFQCSYSGACGNLACNDNIDCEGMEMPCVGVTPQCSEGVCTIGGKCITKPDAPQWNLWNWIQGKWNAFWAWITGLF